MHQTYKLRIAFLCESTEESGHATAYAIAHAMLQSTNSRASRRLTPFDTSEMKLQSINPCKFTRIGPPWTYVYLGAPHIPPILLSLEPLVHGWLVGEVVGRSVGGLVGWSLVGWLVGWLVGRWVGMSVGRMGLVGRFWADGLHPTTWYHSLAGGRGGRQVVLRRSSVGWWVGGSVVGRSVLENCAQLRIVPLSLAKT